MHEHLGTNAPMQVALGSSATEMEAAKAQAHTVVRQNYHIQRITAAPWRGEPCWPSMTRTGTTLPSTPPPKSLT